MLGSRRHAPRRGTAVALLLSGVVHLFMFQTVLCSPQNPSARTSNLLAFVALEVDTHGPSASASLSANASLSGTGTIAASAHDALEPPALPRPSQPRPALLRHGQPRRGQPRQDQPPLHQPADATPTPLGHPPSDDAFLDGLMARHGAPGTAAPGATGAGCPDTIVGTWRARRYDAGRERWAVFTLRIQRDDSPNGTGTLTGTIRLHAWTGSRRDRVPPRCGPHVYEHTVSMNATGALDGDRVRFDAQDHERTVLCMDGGFAYNLDHFTGTVHGDRIVAVNNDGGHEVNAPYTFERVACR